MLAEEPLCAKVVVLRHRAHYVLTAHLVPRDRMCHWILLNVFRTPWRCTARRATADGAPCAGLIGRRTEHVPPGQFRPAITPPSTLRMAPVIQLAPSDNRYVIAEARSSAVPTRPRGWKASKLCSVSSIFSGGTKAS